MKRCPHCGRPKWSAEELQKWAGRPAWLIAQVYEEKLRLEKEGNDTNGLGTFSE
jgi:hypothetical protein